MDAFVASGTPDAVARTGAVNVVGRRYQDIVQDMADMYAWGQDDTDQYADDHVNTKGGWRYSWNGGADNSASQWGAIGMIAAERHFGCSVPQWVKDRNDAWVNKLYDGNGFGYWYWPGTDWATTPSGMVQLSFDGKGTSDPRWGTALNWISSN